MGKDKNFSGQPIFNQLLKLIDKKEIRRIGNQNGAERYVGFAEKSFPDTYSINNQCNMFITFRV